MSAEERLGERVAELESALRTIADGKYVTRPISAPSPASIDGKSATVAYVERLSARDIARAALSSPDQPGERR